VKATEKLNQQAWRRARVSKHTSEKSFCRWHWLSTARFEFGESACYFQFLFTLVFSLCAKNQTKQRNTSLEPQAAFRTVCEKT
jgi:hypothetical protein